MRRIHSFFVLVTLSVYFSSVFCSLAWGEFSPKDVVYVPNRDQLVLAKIQSVSSEGLATVVLIEDKIQLQFPLKEIELNNPHGALSPWQIFLPRGALAASNPTIKPQEMMSLNKSRFSSFVSFLPAELIGELNSFYYYNVTTPTGAHYHFVPNHPILEEAWCDSDRLCWKHSHHQSTRWDVAFDSCLNLNPEGVRAEIKAQLDMDRSPIEGCFLPGNREFERLEGHMGRDLPHGELNPLFPHLALRNGLFWSSSNHPSGGGGGFYFSGTYGRLGGVMRNFNTFTFLCVCAGGI